MSAELIHEEWWRDRSTIIKDLPSNNGINSLHAKQIEGTFYYAIVWWHYGSPTLQLLFSEGLIKFDVEG